MLLKFEILAAAPKDTPLASVKNVSHAISANANLDIECVEQLKESSDKVLLKIANPDESLLENNEKIYRFTFNGQFQQLEPLRLSFLKYLKTQWGFQSYILVDDVSRQIAVELYPYLFNVENSLRGFLIEFMLIQFGSKWWDMLATNQQTQKAHERKKNESNFSEIANTQSYLIDFSDLGQMIYQHSMGYKNVEDILKKIESLNAADTNCIESLKKDVATNYQRYFKSFKDKNFQQKWENFTKLRNKIAHTSLFVNEDLQNGKQWAEELLGIITEAATLNSSAPIAEETKETTLKAISEEYYVNGFKNISEDELILKLKEESEYMEYVGLSYFVTNILGSEGFDYDSSFRMINDLVDRQILEQYTRKTQNGDHQAIRFKQA